MSDWRRRRSDSRVSTSWPDHLSQRRRALRMAILVTLACASVPPDAQAQQTVSPPPPTASAAIDSTRIQAIIAEQVTAWNAGDATAFSRNFAEDGSFTNIRGTVFYGHQAFEDRHAEIFRTFFKGSNLAMSATRIRFVTPDVAIVDIATQLSRLQGAPPGITPGADGTIRTRLQEVFVKQGGVWWIASYHNVDIKAP
jgi:uncharacterized protein (TIGR02246 family)